MAKALRIPVDDDQHKQINEYCERKGVTIAEAGRALFFWLMEHPDFQVKKSREQLVCEREEAA